MNNYKELIELARDYGNKEEWDKCIEYYEDAFSYYNESITIGDLVDLAKAYLSIGETEKSYAIILDVIDSTDNHYLGYHYLGYYYMTIEDDEKALEAFLNSEKLGNNTSECLFHIGLLYDEADEKDKAIEYYMRVLEIDDEHFYANLNLGAIYQEQGKFEKALNFGFKAKLFHPDKYYVNYNIGVVMGLTGKFKEAEEFYLEELKKENFCVDTYYNLAIIYKDYYKDYNKAKDYYLKGLEFNKNDGKYWYNLGCVHCLLKDFKNAYDCFYCAYLINDKVINYLNSDEEVIEFKNSEYYNKLLNL